MTKKIKKGGASASGGLGQIEHEQPVEIEAGGEGDEEMEEGYSVEGESIFDLLKEDHRHVEDLFNQIEAADDDDNAIGLIQEVVQELLAHMRAEEETLYARFRDEEDFSEEILKADEEHAIVHNACRELLQMQEVDERVLAKVKVMKELVLHHVEEEEGQLLPEAEELIGEEAGVALGEEFQARKAALQGETKERPVDVGRAMEMGQPSR